MTSICAAGFRFVDWSDNFFKSDDQLRYEAGRKTVTGNTDRFSLYVCEAAGFTLKRFTLSQCHDDHGRRVPAP